MNVKVKSGQTLFDVAIQEFGTWEAAVDIAHINDMSVTEVPNTGSVLLLPDKVYNRTMMQHCKNNEISPATADDNSGINLRIFTEQFTTEFK